MSMEWVLRVCHKTEQFVLMVGDETTFSFLR